MKHLYFCRHGLSQAQIDNAWGGQNDTPLSDEGRRQAVAAGEKLKLQATRIDLIIASPLSRARVTADLLATEIGYPVDKIEVNDLFKERTFGIYDGQRHAADWFDSHTYQELDDVEGAERIELLQQRAGRGLEYLKSLPQENILLVGHGAFGRSLIRTIQGKPYTDEFTQKDIMNIIPNATVIQLI